MRGVVEKYGLLIVDDEPLIRQSLYEIFRIEGYRVQMVSSAEEALVAIRKGGIDIVLTDLKLPKMSGIDLLVTIKEESPEVEFILITGYGSIESAVEAMKKGAFDYIAKPINDHEVKIIIGNIVEKKCLIAENKQLREIVAANQRLTYGEMIGSSEKMQNVYRIIEAVASTNATILITGESGTGKSLVAKAIHEHDANRKDKPFVEISCGALSETLLESELFGHMKGAFTGAIKDKEGRFEYAKGGTIFLDEIDAFSPNLQVKLLRVLQDGVFERVGDNVTRRTDTRVIVATNRKLPELVEAGDFREDLYYRINVIAIQPPPLRDRKEDIDLLVEYFITKYSSMNKKDVQGISPQTRELFLDYAWPGNIRELENAIEGAVIMARGTIIQNDDIPSVSKFLAAKMAPSSGEQKNLRKVVEEPEREHIIAILRECNGNRSKAAAALGVNRTTLYNKMKKYRIVDGNTNM